MKTLTLLCCLFSLAGFAQTDSTVIRVKPEQAKDRIGKVTTVCGRVASVVFTSIQFNPVYINFSKDYPNQPFAAVLTSDNYKRFKPDPFKLVTSRQVCVTGMVVDYKGKPQIIIENEAMLEIQ